MPFISAAAASATGSAFYIATAIYPNADGEGHVGNVEHWPMMNVNEIDDVTANQAIDGVAQGAAHD